jgi:hypothetical protein
MLEEVLTVFDHQWERTVGHQWPPFHLAKIAGAGCSKAA